MYSIRALRPLASQFTASTLPALSRAYSAKSYEFIQTSEPRPGVGQSTLFYFTRSNKLFTNIS